jgi:F-type H+-transporting ATPase subunit delta
MNVSKHARVEAKGLFRSCRVNGLPDENRVREIVRSAIAARPRGCLAVLRHFYRLLRLDAARRTARVESAAPLSHEFQAAVRTTLTRVYGQALDISFIVKPALLGGLRIKIGSDLYDGNVQARLAALEASF